MLFRKSGKDKKEDSVMEKKIKLTAVIEAVIIIILAAFLISSYINAKEPVPDDVSEENIYSSFTKNEIENMRFSKLAWFSLTTDFDPSQQPKITVGDELTIPYKLTNMTDRELTVNIMAGQDSYEQVASFVSKVIDHPVATGDIHEYTFQPHETLILNASVKVDPNSLVQGGAYILCSSVLVEVTDENIEELNNCYFSISMDKMYLSSK